MAQQWHEKLQSVKTHRLYPFPLYGSDPIQYGLVQSYWTYLFLDCVVESGWRQPWHALDESGEGNPVFSAIHFEKERGTRVIQHSNAPTLTQGRYFGFQPFLAKTTAEPFDPGRTILELCFVADISPSTEEYTRRFWRRFCIDLLSEDEMEHEIELYENHVGMPSI